MTDRYVFYMDECGTLTSCKGDSNENSELNEFCFAIGGVIVPFEVTKNIIDTVKSFKQKWNIPNLHGNKIRGHRKPFRFLENKKNKKNLFQN